MKAPKPAIVESIQYSFVPNHRLTMEALARCRLSAREIRAVLLILNQTNGYKGREEDTIKPEFWENRTRIPKAHLANVWQRLIQWNVIKKDKWVFSVNLPKDWKPGALTLTENGEKAKSPKMVKSTPKTVKPLTENGEPLTENGEKQIRSKENILKKTSKENILKKASKESGTHPPPEMNSYGEFNNVLLTNAEYEKLKQKFGDLVTEKIETLSEGMAKNKRYKYDSHYAAILSWARRDEKKGKNGGIYGKNVQGRTDAATGRGVDRYGRPRIPTSEEYDAEEQRLAALHSEPLPREPT